VSALALLFAATLAAADEPRITRPVLVTGEVVALDAQPIIVPQSNSSPVVLRTYVRDGTAVEAGDVVLRIDPGPDGNQIATLETQLTQAVARAAREAADLDVKAIEAEQAALEAELARERAEIDGAIPAKFLSPLDRDRYQGEVERARHDHAQKVRALEAARAAAARRREDGALEARKLELGLAFAKARVAASEVRAARAGVVAHGFSDRTGRRYDEGESSWPGITVGQIIGADSTLGVRAYALESDRPHLVERAPVLLGFDALPGRTVNAHIATISGAPEARAAWGAGRYFRVEIEFDGAHDLLLKPGMSVRVEPARGTAVAAGPPMSAGRLDPLEGELVSTEVAAIMPPTVRNVWEYTIAQLLPEGTLVKPGMPVAVFESAQVPTTLAQKESALNEKLKQRAKLELDHAEAARAQDIALREAETAAEKAARKATQPAELLRRVDYDKLIVEKRGRAEAATLAARKRDAMAAARRAERALLDAEIAQLEAEAVEFRTAVAAMQVSPAKPGIVIHRTQFNGDKFAVGSQVWIGLSIAEVADPAQLVVQALVPEVQSGRVALGQRARVAVTGANRVLEARVVEIGRVFRAKSRTQPVTVLDVRLALDAPPGNLKPGTAVQVSMLDAAAGASTAVAK